MTLVKHELRQGKTSFLIWTASVGFLLAICIFLFPEMKEQMDGVNDIFASMGSFTEAFGMDRLHFGTLIGFWGSAARFMRLFVQSAFSVKKKRTKRRNFC